MADIKINGATPSAFYFGSTAVEAVYYGSTKLWEAAPALPANTIRCKFSTGYTPDMGTTQTLVDADQNIWDIYNSGTDWSLLFYGLSELESVIAANTTGVTNMASMFYNCNSLTTVPLFDTSSVTDMNHMFYSNDNLISVPIFDTSSVENMENMFEECESLIAVPLFNTSSVTEMNSMFLGCIAVESGALALYTQASTQENPPTYHDDTFMECGSNTVTGAAELDQIPSDWGGNGA